MAQRAGAGKEDAHDAGLFAEGGIIIGKIDGEILAYDGASSSCATGGTRSGGPRQHHPDALLASPHSILVLDLKGERTPAMRAFAGFQHLSWRAKLGPRHPLCQPMRSLTSSIFWIRSGPARKKCADVQNLVELAIKPLR
ncbi:MAG: hypothetical protein R3C31_15685 [Hyphomonadaceae bacterium]